MLGKGTRDVDFLVDFVQCWMQYCKASSHNRRIACKRLGTLHNPRLCEHYPLLSANLAPNRHTKTSCWCPDLRVSHSRRYQQLSNKAILACLLFALQLQCGPQCTRLFFHMHTADSAGGPTCASDQDTAAVLSVLFPLLGACHPSPTGNAFAVEGPPRLLEAPSWSRKVRYGALCWPGSIRASHSVTHHLLAGS